MQGPVVGEFLGTMVLLAFGCGCVANVLLNRSKGQGAGWVSINLGWAMGVLFGVFTAIATGSPQADLNPAVTLFKTLAGVYSFPTAFTLMIAQLAGAFCGAVVVYLVYLPHWEITEDKGAKLGIFSTGPAVRNIPANFLTEFIATLFLILPIMFVFSKNVGGVAPGFGPYLVAMLVYGIGASLGGPTGYAINPARDLGPRIAHAILPIPGKGDSDWGYSWVPVAAPLAGGAVAFFIAKALGVV
ncbi:permease, glycerol uptake facilitator [Thermanaerovibrio velox DSM 12556]|uniref:Permease, glycerol uptake facilitator n=1 Tax=Thermanaerovibrio velox DSM 12556 TaxID=926567 RepID=H0UNI7_9BACT|nr:MIP/aquaporin family protein [Thermanaerovibrio velox]EHM09394.1 permease, glycerol uptake facilitator [Thermanaerovibrio velox DSM 12556]